MIKNTLNEKKCITMRCNVFGNIIKERKRTTIKTFYFLFYKLDMLNLKMYYNENKRNIYLENLIMNIQFVFLIYNI